MVSRERDEILPKHFCSVCIRAAPLMLKTPLDSNTHVIFFRNDNDSVMCIATVSHGECQWSTVKHVL